MPSIRASLALLLMAAAVICPALASRTHRKSSTTHTRSAHHAVKKTHRLHGQQAIDAERVTIIQQALIREHYMTGDTTGQWDATTTAAMKKYQSDQGWQTKLMPDSRAIKKLGLGPDYSGAINAKDASFSSPKPAATIPAEQSAGFAAASGISR